ncbi:hypothetical protein ACFX13_012376 [Malus domestica]
MKATATSPSLSPSSESPSRSPNSPQLGRNSMGELIASKRTFKARLGSDDESDAAKQGCPVMFEQELKEYEINLKDCGPMVLDALFMLFLSRSPQQYLHQYIKAHRGPAMASLSVTTALSSSVHSLVFPRSPPALHPPCFVLPAWRIVSSMKQKKEGRKKEEHVAFVRSKVDSELSNVCASILKLLDPNLAPSALASKYKVFCLKMKGNYHRCTKFKPTCCSSTAATIKHVSFMLRSQLQA